MAAEAQRAPSVREREAVAPRFPAPSDSLAAADARYKAILMRGAHDAAQLEKLATLVGRALGADPDTAEAAEALDGIATFARHLSNDLFDATGEGE